MIFHLTKAQNATNVISIAKGKNLQMISAIKVVQVIQQLPLDSKALRFLVSLADSAYKYGMLTERQEQAFLNALQELKKRGELE